MSRIEEETITITLKEYDMLTRVHDMMKNIFFFVDNLKEFRSALAKVEDDVEKLKDYDRC